MSPDGGQGAAMPPRWRALDDGRGGALFYDLGTMQILKVPEALAAQVLQPGADMHTAALGAWLQENDVDLTPTTAPAMRTSTELPRVGDVSFDLAGACNMGCAYCFEAPLDSRTGPLTAATLEQGLDFAFAAAAGLDRLVFHFGSGEPLIRVDTLRLLVDQAHQRAAQLGIAVGFELTTNATLVTDETAAFMAAQNFIVRVSCDGPRHIHDRTRPMQGGRPSYDAVMTGIEILRRHLPDRLVINTVLSGDTRLLEIWQWARAQRIAQLNVIKVGSFQDSTLALEARAQDVYRQDLKTVCAEMVDDLDAGREAVRFQSVTKLLHRFITQTPRMRYCGAGMNFYGISSQGGVYPCFRYIGLEEYKLGDVRGGVADQARMGYLASDAQAVDNRKVCQGCWARYLCGGGCYADSGVYGPERDAPQLANCSYHVIEIEEAIRFYAQLRETSPEYCLQLAAINPGEVVAQLLSA